MHLSMYAQCATCQCNNFQLPQVTISPAQLARSPKQIELKTLNHDDGKRYVLWWYGAICRAMQRNHVPRVVVWSRQLHDDGTLGNFSSSNVALTSLGQLRVGSVWEGKRSRVQVQYTRREFGVDFREEHWTHALSSAQHLEKTGAELIPHSAYTLPFGARDRSKVLRMNSNQGTLLIPCLEFLRCYGRDQEINRVLTTYGWPEVEHRLLLDEPVPSMAGFRVVDLPRVATDADAHLLAHLRYESFTQRKIRGIHAEIEDELGPFSSRNRIAFPTIGPWFTGPARIEVEGLEIWPGSFLGLRITGYSVPLKPSIHILRTEFPEVGNEDYSGKPHPPRNTREFGEDEITPIDDDLTPDHGTEVLVIADPSIRMLEAAPVTKLTTDKSVSRGSPGPAAEAADVGAPGEAGGSGKGVGLARFVSDIELEPKGALRDLWNGLQHLQSQHPEVLNVLGWFSFEGTTSPSATQELKLLSLGFPEDVEGGKSLSARATKWVYMHTDEPTKPRGVLVVEVGSPLVRGYLFEVQRRIMSTDSDKGAKEEPYCGLAIKAPPGKLPADWIPGVLFQIAEAEGIMRTALANLPSLDGQDYRRSSSNSDEVPGQSTATNALSKLDITFPRRSRESVQPKKGKEAK